MTIIYNTKHRKLTINLNDGKYLHVFPQEQMRISDEDLSSEHMQAFISRGDISVIESDEAKKKTVITPGKDLGGKRPTGGKRHGKKENVG